MDFINIILLVAGLIAGLALGWLRGKQSASATERALAIAVRRDDYDALMQEKTTLAANVENMQTERETLASKLERLEQQLKETSEKAVALKAREEALDQRLKEQPEQVKHEIKTLTATMLEEMSKKFSTQSEKQIGDLLNPLRDRLGDFQKLVTDSFTQQGKEQHSLKSEIEKIVLQADSLTKALRGDVKAQGNWGEIMLERILEQSGLRKDIEYIVQGIDMNLSAADGSRQKPDVIINLPENKHIVIDAKVSLTAYERYSAEADEMLQQAHLRDYLKSIKAHVNGLEQRRYQDNDKLGTPDFVFMFMPVEGAYSLAVQHDNELHSFAWGKRIVIVPPNMLFAMLQTISSLWRIERQNQNAQDIAIEAGALYDKFVGFMMDMNTIGDRITKLQSSYDDAFNKLSKGRGNLVSRSEKLKDLGVKTTKSLLKVVKSSDEESDDEISQIAMAES